MITFALLALAMVALAVALVVWPLYRGRGGGGPAREAINVALYRDRLAELEVERDSGALSVEQFAQAQVELQRDLLENAMPEATATAPRRQPRSALALALLLPLLAGGIYWWLGAPDFIEVESALQHQRAGGGADMDEAMARLRDRLAANPTDLEGWLLLGRSLTVQQQFAAAADTYAQALSHVGEQPDLLALYAEALAMTQGGVGGRPEELALRALELEPDTAIALWLAGYAATERGDFTTAVARWERLLGVLPADNRMTALVQDSLAQARQRLGTAAATAPTAAAAAGGAIRVSVRLDESLGERLAAGDVLFVYAQDPAGGRMPIASVRRDARFPVEVVLDDSTVLIEGRGLGEMPSLNLVARISRSGDATTRSGDLYGEVRWAAGQAQADILIDRVVP